jgi:hypothetical protein
MNKLTILGLALAAAVLLGAYWLAGPEEARPTIRQTAPVSSPMPQEKTAPAPVVAAPASAPAPLPPGTDRQVIREAIHEASISYDPADLPRIQPYLSHPDPEIREAALNGILVLGHAAGAPLLRDAAKRATSPKEAALLLEKADYLELPSAYDLMKAKKLSLPKTKPPERKIRPGANLPQP